MWQQCYYFLLTFIITGSGSVSWNMMVSPVVFVPRGEDAVLSCSFTHPRQQSYSGMITVLWRARESSAPPFFKCSVRNDSLEGPTDCWVPGLRYSLEGDPRRGELSLIIRRVHLGDNGTFFCRVELEGFRQFDQKETQLYVTVKPKILSLSVETSSSSDSALKRLVCKAEGHPLPTITWQSSSRSLSGDHGQISVSMLDHLVSWVPYLDKDVFTCRVESRLGAAERRYPASNTLMITLIVCGLVVLLLLSTGFIFYMRTRVKNQQSLDCPAEDGVEHEQAYAVVTATSLTRSTSSQHAGFETSNQPEEEAGVLYSSVRHSSQ